MSAKWRAGLVLVCVLVTTPAIATETRIEARLDAALHHPGLRGASIGALVVDAADGGVLYAREPDRALVPASNVKILTAVAALASFGPSHRFETEVLADRVPDAEGAVSTLYVRGGGDPALTSEELWRLAADLRRGGLRSVRDAVVVDASLFDAEHWHPSWGRVSARAYNAPISSFSANYGAFAVQVTPGAASGDPVRVVVDPPVVSLRLVNRARTLSPRSRMGLQVDRRVAASFEEVLISGGLPAGADSRTLYRSVSDPVGYAAGVLRLQLEANGIRVAETLRREAVPDDAVSLVRFEGKSLAEVVRLFMKYSNNVIGEGLVKSLAARAGERPAGWQQGIAAIRGELAALGIDLGDAVQVDGSGLSYANRVAPRAFVAALRAAAGSFRFGPEFVASLPIAAADGTLSDRAEGAALGARAKTGSLTRVTSLSGYADRRDGRRLVFSLLVNGFKRGAADAWEGVDGFLEVLVRGDDEVAAAH
ncbi:MAG: D-alanyl-D-alanine carboxypeptidase/D-alanyl-D-alanine-endopeptidase [Deltaproteobacteria bacterium]|nr:D-alanyl-D-alanine carboxypeptidase/D-alanyl-D-alanine-endopeptidase [Deltaproteobacteria bacterium]MBW2362389.1 D-alanyl-D-alanine carboxypeptidase/D-alanyl-D-alanine-endopeptidase [Deltaproteobacteria bacterium]